MNGTGRRHGQSGFTLVEILMTLVILGTLMSLAIPAYLDFARKSSRSDAITSLHAMLSQQTLYFAGSNTYTFVASNLGFGPISPTSLASHVVSREEGYLMILKECETGTSSAECVLIEARAQHGQVQDTECQSFFLNSRGRQSALDDSGNDSTEACWK